METVYLVATSLPYHTTTLDMLGSHVMDEHTEDDYVLISMPDLSTTPTVPSSSAPSHLSTISTYIDHLSPELRHLSLLIHDNPELNYKEYKAYASLVKFFKALEGWEVEEKACGINTAFIAVFDNRKVKGRDGAEGEVVSFNAEYGEYVLHLKHITRMMEVEKRGSDCLHR